MQPLLSALDRSGRGPFNELVSSGHRDQGGDPNTGLTQGDHAWADLGQRGDRSDQLAAALFNPIEADGVFKKDLLHLGEPGFHLDIEEPSQGLSEVGQAKGGKQAVLLHEEEVHSATVGIQKGGFQTDMTSRCRVDGQYQRMVIEVCFDVVDGHWATVGQKEWMLR